MIKFTKKKTGIELNYFSVVLEKQMLEKRKFKKNVKKKKSQGDSLTGIRTPGKLLYLKSMWYYHRN